MSRLWSLYLNRNHEGFRVQVTNSTQWGWEQKGKVKYAEKSPIFLKVSIDPPEVMHL